jgi:hypothetical protein
MRLDPPVGPKLLCEPIELVVTERSFKLGVKRIV